MVARQNIIQDALPGMPEGSQQRFDPDQRRAFGSVMGLLGENLDIPEFERLDSRAVLRVEPTVLRQGLYGQEGINTVNGLVLSAEEYTAIIRNGASFQRAIHAKTTSANRLTASVRADEKLLRSQKGAMDSKLSRHNLILGGLAGERVTLSKLSDWQKKPGYSRAKEIDMRTMASSAWNGSFSHVLDVLRDKHGLSDKEHADMRDAMSYKLFRGGQRDRVGYWGEMLDVALEYNKRREILFGLSATRIIRESGRIAVELREYYDKHGLPPK